MRRGLSLVVLLVVVLSACGGDARTGPLVVSDPNATTYDFDYVIPLGTGERFDNGEDVEVIPAELVVHVGQVLRIVNEDERDALIGPFFVGAGETLVQRFSAVGEFTGLCTVHPSGQFVLRVEP